VDMERPVPAGRMDGEAAEENVTPVEVEEGHGGIRCPPSSPTRGVRYPLGWASRAPPCYTEVPSDNLTGIYQSTFRETRTLPSASNPGSRLIWDLGLKSRFEIQVSTSLRI
jgi:hypothetical protein